MTNTDYYTTQSLATAAVAIEQGFEGVETRMTDTENNNGWFWWNKFLVEYHVMKESSFIISTKAYRFPKNPHNVALMEPVTGDIVKTQDPNDKHHYQLGYWEHVSCYSLLSTPIIIHRNNKPFPVWDKEEV